MFERATVSSMWCSCFNWFVLYISDIENSTSVALVILLKTGEFRVLQTVMLQAFEHGRHEVR